MARNQLGSTAILEILKGSSKVASRQGSDVNLKIKVFNYCFFLFLIKS